MLGVFWGKVSINALAVIVPAILTIPGFGILVRVADNAAVGTVMWTWFLIGTAATLNAGFNPALTNEFGYATERNTRQHLSGDYIQSANVIYGSVSIITLTWTFFSGTLHLFIVVPQLLLIWTTGISTLLMTTLNAHGRSDRTALSKLFYNSLVLFAPIGALAAGASLSLAISLILVVKILQLFQLISTTTVLAEQRFDRLKQAPFSIAVFERLLRKQWRVVVISIAQMLVAFIDRFAVSAVFGIEAYKGYSGIQDLLTKVWLLSSIFIILLHPIFADSLKSYQSKLQLSVHYSRILFVIGGVGIGIAYLNLELVLEYVFALQLTPEISVIYMNLSLGVAISLSYILYNTLLIASGHQDFVLKISLFSLAIYCAALFPVINVYGLVGLSYMFLGKFCIEALIFHVYVFTRRTG